MGALLERSSLRGHCFPSARRRRRGGKRRRDFIIQRARLRRRRDSIVDPRRRGALLLRRDHCEKEDKRKKQRNRRKTGHDAASEPLRKKQLCFGAPRPQKKSCFRPARFGRRTKHSFFIPGQSVEEVLINTIQILFPTLSSMRLGGRIEFLDAAQILLACFEVQRRVRILHMKH